MAKGSYIRIKILRSLKPGMHLESVIFDFLTRYTVSSLSVQL